MGFSSTGGLLSFLLHRGVDRGSCRAYFWCWGGDWGACGEGEIDYK